jgi:20S proteasome subunit beta 2
MRDGAGAARACWRRARTQIHYITDNIRCCGAGTAADTEFTTALVASNMALHALGTGRKPRVVTAMTMLKQRLFQCARPPPCARGRWRRRRRHQGQIGAALVLGGVDSAGSHLFTVAPHGSTDKLPYVTMGSGSLAAMAVFEAGWKQDLSVRRGPARFVSRCWPSPQREAALQLVTAAISAGIFNDLGSGSNVDACVITAAGTETLRNFVTPNERVAKENKYGFRRGTTAWTKEDVRKLVVGEEVNVVKTTADAMDTS